MSQTPPSMVLLPGLAGHAGEFAAQRDRFGRHRRVLALDPFGEGDLRVSGQADQLANLVRRQHLGPVVVVGHSHGGVVSLAMAARHPHLVAGLIVLDAPILLPRAVRVLARAPLTALHTALARPLLRRFFTATFTEADTRAWRSEVLKRLDDVPARVARAAVHGTFTYDTAEALQRLAVPTMVVQANIPLRAERLPGHVLSHRVSGVGHWPHVHAPEAVNDLIARFIAAGHDAPATGTAAP